MVDDRPEDTGSLPGEGRPKREPPTIELEATEVSSETKSAAGASSEAPSGPSPEPTPEAPSVSPVDGPTPRPVSPWIVAPVSGAVAAALVIGVGWMLGWPAIQSGSAPPAPQLGTAIDALTARVAGLEPKVGKPVSYPAALAATKALAPNPDALKPLDQFAEKGVPNAGRLSSELLALVPKLLPAAQQSNATTTGTGIVERLQAGAAKLVKIERTDTAGNDRGAVVARVTAAALRNDFNEARRELKTLEPADRAAAQSWLERADARDAALAASRQLATDAMAALAKPAQ